MTGIPQITTWGVHGHSVMSGTVGGDRGYMVLTAVGPDRPGLANHAINVASLESRLSYAPFSATPLFVLDASLQVPSNTVLAEVRAELATTCDEENLDFRLDPGA